MSNEKLTYEQEKARMTEAAKKITPALMQIKKILDEEGMEASMFSVGNWISCAFAGTGWEIFITDGNAELTFNAREIIDIDSKGE